MKVKITAKIEILVFHYAANTFRQWLSILITTIRVSQSVYTVEKKVFSVERKCSSVIYGYSTC